MGLFDRLNHVGLLAVVSICGACSEPAPAASTSAKPSAAASGSVAVSVKTSAAPKVEAPAPKAIELDPEVQKLVKAAAEKCKVSDYDERVENCDAEMEAIGKYAKEKKPKNFHLTLAETALTDGAKDKKVYAVALNALGNYVESGGREWLKAGATPEVVERTLKILTGAPQNFGDYLYGAAKLGWASGKFEETVAALKASKAKVRRSAFSSIMGVGGIAGLPTVQALVKDTALKPDERAGALRSVNGAVDPGIFGDNPVLPEADKTKACDWAKELINDETKEIADAAADALSVCGSSYIDAALVGLATRVEKEPASNSLIGSVFHQCWGQAVVGRKPNGNMEQCKKAIELVDKLSKKDPLQAGDANWINIVAGGIGRDCEECKPKAKEILGRFKDHKEKYVADSAKKELDKLK